MGFKIGIVGLPNAGKSTLFNLLTKKEVDIDSYPFTTISPNLGIVEIPDKRMEEISGAVLPEKKIYPILEFVDVAGLIEGAHKGEGLGNQFLSHLKGCRALLQVIRDFGDNPSPEKDKKIIERELLLKDIEHLSSLEKKLRGEERVSLIKNLKEKAQEGTPLREIKLKEEEIESIKEFQFLTLKPISYLYNGKSYIDLKLERELKDLSSKEKEELGITSRLDQLLLDCYNSFALITFFTIANRKAQGWIIERGKTILEAAEMVHSDFRDNFKRAEIVSLEDLKEARSFEKSRSQGKVKTVGKDYQVKEGDIIEFKI